MTDLKLQDAAHAVALAYSDSPSEDPQVTDYMLRLIDRVNELENQNDSLKHSINVLETNINLKANFIDAAINDSAADHQTIQTLKTTLEDISHGKGMFGLNAEEDLKWAMNLAGRTVEAIEERQKK